MSQFKAVELSSLTEVQRKNIRLAVMPQLHSIFTEMYPNNPGLRMKHAEFCWVCQYFLLCASLRYTHEQGIGK
jgi:hypothetical protein